MLGEAMLGEAMLGEAMLGHGCLSSWLPTGISTFIIEVDNQ
jgi:hypothetical protein